MKAEDILAQEDFKKCVNFHGHLCPGLSIGYRASQTGMEWLRANRASDEEIVAIVETDACCADAVQVITGCTFGKGVRIALKADTIPGNKRHWNLIKKIQTDTATESEREEFKKLHKKKSFEILEKPIENLFNVQEVRIALPAKAKIEPSNPCDRCGEPTMVSKLSEVAGLLICRNCNLNQ